MGALRLRAARRANIPGSLLYHMIRSSRLSLRFSVGEEPGYEATYTSYSCDTNSKAPTICVASDRKVWTSTHTHTHTPLFGLAGDNDDFLLEGESLILIGCLSMGSSEGT